MNLIRLNCIFSNYGRMVKFGPPSRGLIQTNGGSFIMRSSPLKEIVTCTPYACHFNGSITRPFFVYVSHLRTSCTLKDLEIVPNSKASQLNIPPTILTADPSNLKMPNSTRAASSPNENSTNTTPNSVKNNAETAMDPKKPKKSLWAKMKKEMLHYYNGFRLLGVEIRISAFMCYRFLRGEKLSDRERNQFVRTCVDVLRLVPFLVFIIVPFMEFLLPFYLKFFPFMLPSTFREKIEEEKKIKNVLQTRIKMAKFLQDTIVHTVSRAVSVSAKDLPRIEEFQAFMATVRESGKMARNEDIIKFSRLFEDHVTLDALSQEQLAALCRMIDVRPFGGKGIMKLQLHRQLRKLKQEDIKLLNGGIEELTVGDLRLACRNRGMRTIELTEARLKTQLMQWLELHIVKKVPVSLLLLTRAFYLSSTTVPPEQQIQTVISKLPEEVQDQATVKAVTELPGELDPAMKLEIIRKEQKHIDAHRIAEKDVKKAAEVASLEILTDKADVLEPHFSEQLNDTAKKLVAKSLDKPLKPIIESNKSTESNVDAAPTQPPVAVSTIAEPMKNAKEKIATAESAVAAEIPLTPETMTPDAELTEDVAKEKEDDFMVTAKDIDSIKEAILKMDVAKDALEEEQILDLKADLDQAVKVSPNEIEKEIPAVEELVPLSIKKDAEFGKERPRLVEFPAEMKEDFAITKKTEGPTPTIVPVEPVQPIAAKTKIERESEKIKDVSSEVSEIIPEVVTAKEEKEEVSEIGEETEDKVKAAKQAAKDQKALKRLNKQVSRLLGDISGLMDRLQSHKQKVQQKLETEIQTLSEEEKLARIEELKIDQQRMVGVGSLMATLEKLQQQDLDGDPEARARWQKILIALDEDQDGQIELKHILGLLEIFEGDKDGIKMSSMANALEMLDQEDMHREVVQDEKSSGSKEDQTEVPKDPKSSENE